MGARARFTVDRAGVDLSAGSKTVSQSLDEARPCPGLDQYQNYTRRDLFCCCHAHRNDSAHVSQGQHGTPTKFHARQLSPGAPVAAGVAHDQAVLIVGGSMGEFFVELWGFMKERKKFWLLPTFSPWCFWAG